MTKTKKFFFGILVITLVFGMMVAGCDNGSTGGNNNNNTTNGGSDADITDTVTADGSSIEQAITLSITAWKDGSVVTGEAKWYKFTAASETSYRVQWKDTNEKPDSDNYTAWVQVTAYQSDGTTNISTINESTFGYKSPKTVSGVSGTVYLKVEPYDSFFGDDYPGTYAIRFYDPAILVPQVPIIISSASATPVPNVVVTWNSTLSTSNVSGYRVYRSSSQTGTYAKIGADITSYSTTRYTDTDVSVGSTYWYKVAAYNSVGEGDKSDAKQSDAVPATSDVTLLNFGTQTNGTISSATQVNWYKFTAVSGTTYNVQWEDSYQQSGSIFTGDIKVSAFNSTGAPISGFQNIDSGYTTPKTVSGVTGTVYLRVEAFSVVSAKTGIYVIKVTQQ